MQLSHKSIMQLSHNYTIVSSIMQLNQLCNCLTNQLFKKLYF